MKDSDACAVFPLNVIYPLCLQAWLAAVSWLDDEIRPAVAQMIWALTKTRKLSLCFAKIRTFFCFNKDAAYFGTFWTFFCIGSFRFWGHKY